MPNYNCIILVQTQVSLHGTEADYSLSTSLYCCLLSFCHCCASSVIVGWCHRLHYQGTQSHPTATDDEAALIVVNVDLQAAARVVGPALKALVKSTKFSLERKTSGVPIAQHLV